MNVHTGRRLGLGLAVLTLAAAACGSTVPKALLQQQLNGQGLGPGGAVGPSAGTQGTIIPGAAGNAGSTGQLSGGSTGAAGGPGSLGPGITSSTIFIGTVDVKNQGAANSAIGAGGGDVPDYRGSYDTVINDVNAHGGIAGRKLQAVWAEFDTTSSQTISQQGQAACATWTQDHKVFAFFGDVQGGSTQACAETAHTVDIVPGSDSSAPEDFQRYPHYLEISGMNVVRIGSVVVKGLHVQNYFTPGLKLGIVTWDLPNYHESMDRGYGPALNSYGVSLAIPTAFVHAPQTYNDLGGMNADINSAVLKFQQQHIDHVMIVDGTAGICAGACLTYEFLNEAQSQGYTPRYGFGDPNYADTSVNSLYPASQLTGSVAVVWEDQLSSQDVDKQHPNKPRDACLALMQAHGVTTSGSNQRYVALSACEQIWFLRDVVSRMGGAVLNADNFIRAANTIGTSFQPLDVYASHITAEQHDGASAARNEAYFDSCTCYRYTSGIYPV